MKKPKILLEAEAAARNKKVELDTAEDAVSRIQREWHAALAAVRDAQMAFDDTLPQCRYVRVCRRSGYTEVISKVVIVRRTPRGKLVVRMVGDLSGKEIQLNWVGHAGAYIKAEKGWTRETRELRDVPAEYLPTANKAGQ